MGTTAEKLNYLKETKTEIKNALETPSNIFRDYPDLIKKYIDNQPTKVASDGVCSNAVDLPTKAINVDGNREQKTTEGRQLFDNTLKGYGHYGMIATTIPTGVRLSVGTDVTTSDYNWGIYAIMNLSDYVGKTVRMKAMIKPNSNLKGTYSIGLCDSNGANRVSKDNTNTSGKEISFVVPNLETGQEYLGVWFYANAGGTGVAGNYVDYTNVIITIDNEDMTYEPYTGGMSLPNPEYPQEIEVIDTGYNLAYSGWAEDFANRISDIQKAKIETKDGRKCLYYRGDAGGDNYNAKYLFKTNWKENTQYTISFDIYPSEKYANILLEYTDGTTSYPAKWGWLTVQQWQHLSATSDSNKTIKYIRCEYASGFDYIDLDTFTIYEGTTQKPYLSYGSIGLEQNGKNKLDFKKFLENANAVYTERDGVFNLTDKGKLYSALYKLNLKPNTTYTIYQNFQEQNSTNVRLTIARGSNYENVVESYSTSEAESYRKKTFTTDESSDYYIRGDWSVSNLPLIYNEPILVEGTDVIPYEPYHEPIITPINLQGNTLGKVGDVKDILRVNRNGEVEIKKNIGKVVLTGEEVLIDNSSTSIRKWWGINFSNYGIYQYNDPTKVCDVLTTKFKPRPQQGTFLPKQVALTTKNKNMYFVFEPDTTEEQARAILTDMPVYFRLAEPQTIKLSSISPIELWQGTNIFKLITNLDTTFEVEYIVNKDSVLNEVQTAMLEAEIEI